jgi:predicted nucleic acid-binding protein
MNDIVSNATPLIYLAKIGRLNLLKKVFEQILVPEEVKVEVVDRGKDLGERDAYLIEKAINDRWIKVLKSEILEIPIKLEPGEIAALSLAKNLGLKEVLVDEVPARTVARLLGLTPRGTIFPLLKALESKELNLNEFLEILNELIKQGFRLKEEVYLETIRKAREMTEK